MNFKRQITCQKGISSVWISSSVGVKMFFFVKIMHHFADSHLLHICASEPFYSSCCWLLLFDFMRMKISFSECTHNNKCQQKSQPSSTEKIVNCSVAFLRGKIKVCNRAEMFQGKYFHENI